MSRCWPEGELRAWLDHELSPPQMEAIERHLTECRHCSTLSAELSARAGRVAVLLGALNDSPAVPMLVRRRAPAGALAAAVTLAAASLLWIVLIHKRPHSAARPVTPVILSPARPKPEMPLSKPVKPPIRHAAARNDLHYYLALDDDPIDSGVVLRVTLPDSGLLADVIFDEQGRPRAVRPLN